MSTPAAVADVIACRISRAGLVVVKLFMFGGCSTLFAVLFSIIVLELMTYCSGVQPIGQHIWTC
jgi:phage-related holin